MSTAPTRSASTPALADLAVDIGVAIVLAVLVAVHLILAVPTVIRQALRTESTPTNPIGAPR